jgi:hypothetical protein
MQHPSSFERLSAVRLCPVTLLREPFRGFEEAFDRGDLVVLSPDCVDCQHRPWRRQVDELDAAGEFARSAS